MVSGIGSLRVPFLLTGPAQPEAADSTGATTVNQLLSKLMREFALADEAPPYEVVKVRYAEASEGHEHVEYVETRDPDGGETRWAWAEVVSAIRGGERFVLIDGGTEAKTILGESVCPACPAASLRRYSPES